MKVLVTGANGQLAKCLKDIVEKNGNGPANSFIDWIFADRKTLDITNLDAVTDYIKENFINVVVNCAAYTNVNKAEEIYDDAYAVNVCGSEILAHACKSYGAVLIHISTDYVFDGTKGMPYKPSDKTHPLNNYGKSKADGETLIANTGCKYLIFRTSWLYSQYGKNFVKTISKKCLNNEKCSVVNDQIGCPTNANDLAAFIYRIVTTNNADNRYLSKTGIYHYCNSGVASWYDLAVAIYKLNCAESDNITAISTPEGGVNRPAYSVLDTKMTEDTFNEKIRYWRDSLEDVTVVLHNNISLID